MQRCLWGARKTHADGRVGSSRHVKIVLIYILSHILAYPNTSCLSLGPAGLWVGSSWDQ